MALLPIPASHDSFFSPSFFCFLPIQCLLTEASVMTKIGVNNFELKHAVFLYTVSIVHGMGSTPMVDFENSYGYSDCIFCIAPNKYVNTTSGEQAKTSGKNWLEYSATGVDQLLTKRSDSCDAH